MLSDIRERLTSKRVEQKKSQKKIKLSYALYIFINIILKIMNFFKKEIPSFLKSKCFKNLEHHVSAVNAIKTPSYR